MKSKSLLFLLMISVAIFALAAADQKTSDKKDKKKDAAAPAGDAKTGEAVFAKNCALCHYADSTESKMLGAPGLKDLFKSEKLPSGKPADEKNVTERINKGSDKMPAFEKKLSKKELTDLLAYLKTL